MYVEQSELFQENRPSWNSAFEGCKRSAFFAEALEDHKMNRVIIWQRQKASRRKTEKYNSLLRMVRGRVKPNASHIIMVDFETENLASVLAFRGDAQCD